MDNLYLLFSIADYYFLAPLTWVKSIEDGLAGDEELPVLRYIKDENGGVHEAHRYRIVLENEELRFGVEADGVAGIEEIAEERFIELGEPVINERNKYLRAAVFMQTAQEKEILAFVLDLQYLVEKEELWNL